MSFSFIAMNRVAEEKAARDAAYRAKLKRNGKVLLSEARDLSDDALLAKLAEFGIALDREGYWLQKRDLAAACDCWLGVWRDFLTLLERSGVRSIAEFDEEFRGTQFVANWVQDLDIALSNASAGTTRT